MVGGQAGPLLLPGERGGGQEEKKIKSGVTGSRRPGRAQRGCWVSYLNPAYQAAHVGGSSAAISGIWLPPGNAIPGLHPRFHKQRIPGPLLVLRASLQSGSASLHWRLSWPAGSLWSTGLGSCCTQVVTVRHPRLAVSTREVRAQRDRDDRHAPPVQGRIGSRGWNGAGSFVRKRGIPRGDLIRRFDPPASDGGARHQGISICGYFNVMI